MVSKRNAVAAFTAIVVTATLFHLRIVSIWEPYSSGNGSQELENSPRAMPVVHCPEPQIIIQTVYVNITQEPPPPTPCPELLPTPVPVVAVAEPCPTLPEAAPTVATPPTAPVRTHPAPVQSNVTRLVREAQAQGYQYIAHVISHTHWDREWYLPYEVFRKMLVEVVDLVLDTQKDPRMGNFLLDGQSITVEDYLEIRPQMRQAIADANAASKLSVGPWYTQPDEFLCSGENLVRNLAVGLRLASEYGPNQMRLGYLPDSFGHASQVPQIFHGFDIFGAVFARGPEDLYKPEFIWEAPDGSGVSTIFLKLWYCHGKDAPAYSEHAMDEYFKKHVNEALGKNISTRHVIVMHGCDHSNFDPTILTGIELANKMQLTEKRYFAIHSNLDDYITLVKEEQAANNHHMQVRQGELRNNIASLANVLSTLVRQKQQNFRIQTLLEKYVEPMRALTWNLGVLAKYNADMIWYAWRILIQNHAHDSSGACSVGAVHEEVHMRMQKVEQLSLQLAHEAAIALADGTLPQFPERNAQLEPQVVVFNPDVERTDYVMVEIDVAEGLVGEHVKVNVIDLATKQPVPAVVISVTGDQWDWVNPKFSFRTGYSTNRFIVAFLPTVPAVGYKTFKITRERGSNCNENISVPTFRNDGVLENEFLRVTIRGDDAGVDILHKASQKTFSSNYILDIHRDLGDEYHADIMGWGDGATQIQIGSVYVTPVYEMCAVSFVIAGDFHIPFTTYYILGKNSTRVDVRTTFTNQVQNFILRAKFGSWVGSTFADSAFDILERSVPSEVFPLQSFVGFSQGDQGLVVATKGLHEFQMGDVLRITLLRAVGKMGDWGPFPTPTGQEQGDHSFELSIIPFVGTDRSPAIIEARKFVAPMMAVQAKGYPGNYIASHPQIDLTRYPLATATQLNAKPGCNGERGSQSWGGGADFTYTNKRQHIQIADSLVSIQPADLVLSAIKIAYNSSSLIVRIFNPFEREFNATIRVSEQVQFTGSAYLCKLSEDRIEPLVVTNRTTEFNIKKKKIITIEFESKDRTVPF